MFPESTFSYSLRYTCACSWVEGHSQKYLFSKTRMDGLLTLIQAKEILRVEDLDFSPAAAFWLFSDGRAIFVLVKEPCLKVTVYCHLRC